MINLKIFKKKLFSALITLILLLTFKNVLGEDFLLSKLEKAKKEKKFVMLELGAKGCEPCEKMRPVMDRLSKNYGEKLEVIFVDVRAHPEIAKKWGITVIPVQVFLDEKGREIHRHIGYYPYEKIVSMLKKFGL